MATRTKFTALDEKRVKEGAARTASKYDSIFKQGVTILKMKQGVNNLRIVRGRDQSYWGETIWCHSRVGTKNSTYLCPKAMGKGKKCPVCDAAQEAQANGDGEEAKALTARERTICYLINRDDEKAGLQVWDMSWNQHQEIDAVCDTKRGVLDISHADAGFDISIIRQGALLNTRYTGLNIDRESTPLSESSRQQEAWLDEIESKPLSSLLKFHDVGYLADILSGKIEEKDEDDEDDEERKGKRNGNARERDEEEEEEDERPRTRAARRDDPDDEDERPRARSRRDANGEDEEEKPRTRTQRRDIEVDEAGAEEAEAQRWKRGRGRDTEDDEEPVSRKARNDSEDEKRPRARSVRDDDEEEEAPRSRRSRADEEEPRARSRRGEAEDEETPRTRSRARSDDDDDEAPRSRRATREDEDDEPRSRRR